MRFLSDDNKVFNTIEECEQHEKDVKRKSEADAREKARKEAYDALKRRYDSICELISNWCEDFDEFQKEYNYQPTKKDVDNLDEFIKFLETIFEVGSSRK